MEIKILGIEDFDLIIKFSKEKRKISGLNNADWEWNKFEKTIEESLRNPSQNTVVAAFENGQLEAYVSQHFSEYAPSWYMSMVLQRYSGWLRAGHGDYLNACLIEATRISEERGIFEVTYTMPAKWLRTTKRTQPTSPVWSRYNVYVDAFIPAGELPQYFMHKYMHGGPKDHDRVIKRCSLKMEHRLEYFKKQGYDIDTAI